MAGIGILGGTFNPPHLGHLAVARAARRELGLERVLLMPVHTPAHKSAGEDPGPGHRLAMCELLASDEPWLEASDLEIARGAPSYTADTLSSIHASHPEAELTFIVGADTARTLPSWHEPASVLRLAQLAVATRSGSERAEVEQAIETLDSNGDGDPADERPGVRFLDMSPIDVSSSTARARARDGEQLEELLGPAVAEYVARRGLYRGDHGGEA